MAWSLDSRLFFFYRAQFALEPGGAAGAVAFTSLLTRGLESAWDEHEGLDGEIIVSSWIYRGGEQTEIARGTFRFVDDVNETRYAIDFLFDGSNEKLALQGIEQPASVVVRHFQDFFNHAPPNARGSRLLKLYPLGDEDRAATILKSVVRLGEFRADLRRPNPDTHKLWADFWKKTGGDSNADTATISVNNVKGELTQQNVKDSSNDTALVQAVRMSNAGYGRWAARGLDREGHPIDVTSQDTHLRAQIPVGESQTIEGITTVFETMSGRLESQGAVA